MIAGWCSIALRASFLAVALPLLLVGSLFSEVALQLQVQSVNHLKYAAGEEAAAVGLQAAAADSAAVAVEKETEAAELQLEAAKLQSLSAEEEQAAIDGKRTDVGLETEAEAEAQADADATAGAAELDTAVDQAAAKAVAKDAAADAAVADETADAAAASGDAAATEAAAGDAASEAAAGAAADTAGEAGAGVAADAAAGEAAAGAAADAAATEAAAGVAANAAGEAAAGVAANAAGEAAVGVAADAAGAAVAESATAVALDGGAVMAGETAGGALGGPLGVAIAGAGVAAAIEAPKAVVAAEGVATEWQADKDEVLVVEDTVQANALEAETVVEEDSAATAQTAAAQSVAIAGGYFLSAQVFQTVAFAFEAPVAMVVVAQWVFGFGATVFGANAAKQCGDAGSVGCSVATTLSLAAAVGSLLLGPWASTVMFAADVQSQDPNLKLISTLPTLIQKAMKTHDGHKQAEKETDARKLAESHEKSNDPFAWVAAAQKEAQKAADGLQKEAQKAAPGLQKEAQKAADGLQKQAQEAQKAAGGLQKEVQKTADGLQKAAPGFQKEAQKAANELQKQAQEAQKAADGLQKAAPGLQKEAQKTADGLQKQAEEAQKAADGLQKEAQKTADGFQKQAQEAQEAAGGLQKEAQKTADGLQKQAQEAQKAADELQKEAEKTADGLQKEAQKTAGGISNATSQALHETGKSVTNATSQALNEAGKAIASSSEAKALTNATSSAMKDAQKLSHSVAQDVSKALPSDVKLAAAAAVANAVKTGQKTNHELGKAANELGKAAHNVSSAAIHTFNGKPNVKTTTMAPRTTPAPPVAVSLWSKLQPALQSWLGYVGRWAWPVLSSVFLVSAVFAAAELCVASGRHHPSYAKGHIGRPLLVARVLRDTSKQWMMGMGMLVALWMFSIILAPSLQIHAQRLHDSAGGGALTAVQVILCGICLLASCLRAMMLASSADDGSNGENPDEELSLIEKAQQGDAKLQREPTNSEDGSAAGAGTTVGVLCIVLTACVESLLLAMERPVTAWALGNSYKSFFAVRFLIGLLPWSLMAPRIWIYTPSSPYELMIPVALVSFLVGGMLVFARRKSL